MRIAVYIDCENIHSDYIDQAFCKLKDMGEIVRATGYCDFSNPFYIGYQDVLLAHRIRGVQVFHNTKDGADAEIIIDSLTDAITCDDIDAICIISGDGIYGALGRAIRERGKQFIGVGKANASRAFVVSCDTFIRLSFIKNPKGVPLEEINSAIESLGGNPRLSLLGLKLQTTGFTPKKYGYLRMIDLFQNIQGYTLTQDAENGLDWFVSLDNKNDTAI